SQYFHKISTVKDALTAVKVGVRSAGVTAMHDSTEGGVLSAIHELASASSLGAYVYKKQMLLSSEAREVCDLFGIDPYISLGEGALALSCVPEKASEITATLGASGIGASVVGELKEKSDGTLILEDGRRNPIGYPVVDPYWAAYYTAKEKGWN
ncbi:MAG: AIR synthase-related protein, partial [Nitrososphaerales archaeon]